MADGHLSPHAEGARPFRNQLDGEAAQGAGLVQVNIDARAVALGDGKNSVEVADRVSLDDRGVDAADQFCAHLHRCVHQFGGARAYQHAALGKGDQLHRQAILQPLASRHDAFQIGETYLGVDIDVTANVGRALANSLPHQFDGLVLGGYVELPPQPALGFDLVDGQGTGLVRAPGQSPKSLVQMHVSIDEPRKQELSIAILGGDLWAGCQAGRDLGDDAVLDPQIDGRGPHGPDVSEE